jgi:hypothetical protein
VSFDYSYFSDSYFGYAEPQFGIQETGCYFDDYFSDYFEICVEEEPAEAPRMVGGYSPTKAEWEAYLRKWHDRRRQEAAEKAVSDGIRETLRNLLFPEPPKRVARQAAEQKTEPKTVTHLPKAKVSSDLDTRIQIARILLDIRQRTNVLRKIKKLKRRKKRDDEALLTLWGG